MKATLPQHRSLLYTTRSPTWRFSQRRCSFGALHLCASANAPHTAEYQAVHFTTAHALTARWRLFRVAHTLHCDADAALRHARLWHAARGQPGVLDVRAAGRRGEARRRRRAALLQPDRRKRPGRPQPALRLPRHTRQQVVREAVSLAGRLLWCSSYRRVALPCTCP